MIKVRRIKRFLVMINYRKLLSVIKFLKLIKNKKINNVLEKYQKIKILIHWAICTCHSHFLKMILFSKYLDFAWIRKIIIRILIPFRKNCENKKYKKTSKYCKIIRGTKPSKLNYKNKHLWKASCPLPPTMMELHCQYLLIGLFREICVILMFRSRYYSPMHN